MIMTYYTFPTDKFLVGDEFLSLTDGQWHLAPQEWNGNDISPGIIVRRQFSPWIQTNDLLPPIWHVNNDFAVISNGRITISKFINNHGISFYDPDVTHWFPLPALPKNLPQQEEVERAAFEGWWGNLGARFDGEKEQFWAAWKARSKFEYV